MAKYINPDILDLALAGIAAADGLSVCADQPGTFYEACNPAAWTSEMSASLGDAARPTGRNGYAYECTTAGTAGTTEPTWPTTPGETVTDGSITWACRANYCLAATTMDETQYTVGDGETGRKITVASQDSMTIHTAGTAGHIALTKSADKSLALVTTCANQDLIQGNLVTSQAFSDEISNPT